LATSSLTAADWDQWRGPANTGAIAGPELLSELPDVGLTPAWISEKLPGAQNGGWASPVISDGRVYLFAHKKIKAAKGELGPQKFPWLPPDKRTGMTDEQYEQYEVNRRDEQELRAKNYRFDEMVYCLNAESGKLEWTNQEKSFYTRFSQSTTPTVAEGKVFVAGAARVIRALDAKSGKPLWKVRLPGSFRDEMMQASPMYVDGVLIVSVGNVFGLNAKTGETLWQYDSGDSEISFSSPVLWRNDGANYAIMNMPRGETVCLAVASGKEMWREETFGGRSTPVVVGDMMLTYGSSRKGGMRRFDLSISGIEHRWSFQKAADSGSSPVVVGDYAYVQGEKRLACVDLETGDSMWNTSLDLSRPRYTSPVACGDQVFYTFDSVLCFAATPEKYTPQYTAKVGPEGLLATEDSFRKQLKLDELERTAEGQKESEKLQRDTFDGTKPLACASPAIDGGRLILRLKDRVVCYDLQRR